MYLWRVSIAITFGLVWYFSDSGRSLTQYFICFIFCLSTPLLSGNHGRESSTQTDEETEKHPLQETAEEEPADETDEGSLKQPEPPRSHYPHAKRSLQQVFECAYAQLVLPWYAVPEPREHQPLHKVLTREFEFVIDRVIEKAKDFDVCQAVVGSIRILTQHLHNAKQPDRELLFSSRAQEITVLRELSDALVRNLFPQSLWGQEVNRCALNEIIALKAHIFHMSLLFSISDEPEHPELPDRAKQSWLRCKVDLPLAHPLITGLGLVVNWLSDPDNLNQLVVNQLDSVTLKSSAEELHVSDPDHVSLASQEAEGEGEGSLVSLEGAGVSASSGTKGKRKGNRLKEGFSKLVEKMKSKKAKKKKMKKVEQELMMRIMAIQGDASNEDDVSSREGSVLSHVDSDRDDSDLEDYLASVQEDMMEFKLSYEMWRAGHWAVSIPHADWENEELIFTVHLEEKDSPENLQWDIKKTYTDVIYFRNRWQDSTNIPTIDPLEESEVNHEVKEGARLSVERFLQELISDDLIGHSQPVFQFLCPLDKLLNEEVHYGGVWGLLSGLAYFLTPGQEEEENSSPQTEVPRDNAVPHPHPELSALSAGNHCNSAENRSYIPDSPLPTIIISQCDSPPQVPEEVEANPHPRPAVNSDSSNENSFQDNSEDSDNPLTSHFKMFMRGLTRSRSQESLNSAKASGDEEPSDSGLQQDGLEGLSWLSFSAKSNKKEKTYFRMSGVNKVKGKEAQGPFLRGEDSQCQRGQVSWEQLEATKAIFDLLKEISGNSILINIFDAILKPVMPILKKKVNSFLNKVNPTEEQMAAYIDTLRSKLWPEFQATASPASPRTSEEKSETRERAHNLISARYSNYLILKKTDMESVFNLFQDTEENKTLVYMLLSFLLKEFLPNEHSLNVSAAILQKVTNSAN